MKTHIISLLTLIVLSFAAFACGGTEADWEAEQAEELRSSTRVIDRSGDAEAAPSVDGELSEPGTTQGGGTNLLYLCCSQENGQWGCAGAERCGQCINGSQCFAKDNDPRI